MLKCERGHFFLNCPYTEHAAYAYFNQGRFWLVTKLYSKFVTKNVAHTEHAAYVYFNQGQFWLVTAKYISSLYFCRSVASLQARNSPFSFSFLLPATAPYIFTRKCCYINHALQFTSIDAVKKTLLWTNVMHNAYQQKRKHTDICRFSSLLSYHNNSCKLLCWCVAHNDML